jgi:hypothetical protein
MQRTNRKGQPPQQAGLLRVRDRVYRGAVIDFIGAPQDRLEKKFSKKSDLQRSSPRHRHRRVGRRRRRGVAKRPRKGKWANGEMEKWANCQMGRAEGPQRAKPPFRAALLTFDSDTKRKRRVGCRKGRKDHMPMLPAAAPSFSSSGFSATITSVVSTSAAIDAAF